MRCIRCNNTRTRLYCTRRFTLFIIIIIIGAIQNCSGLTGKRNIIVSFVTCGASARGSYRAAVCSGKNLYTRVVGAYHNDIRLVPQQQPVWIVYRYTRNTSNRFICF